MIVPFLKWRVVFLSLAHLDQTRRLTKFYDESKGASIFYFDFIQSERAEHPETLKCTARTGILEEETTTE